MGQKSVFHAEGDVSSLGDFQKICGGSVHRSHRAVGYTMSQLKRRHVTSLKSGDSWMYPYQHTPMGNPYINPIYPYILKMEDNLLLEEDTCYLQVASEVLPGKPGLQSQPGWRSPHGTELPKR